MPQAPSTGTDTTTYFGKSDEVIGWVRMTVYVGLHNHSAQVGMRVQSNHKIRFTWRLRIQHDRNNWPDETIFVYPDVEGCSYYGTTVCYTTEDRYGDGWNKLPYQNKWKVFFEMYKTSLIYNGEKYPGSPSAKSDRFYCYKTVSCKFSV